MGKHGTGLSQSVSLSALLSNKSDCLYLWIIKMGIWKVIISKDNNVCLGESGAAINSTTVL